MLLRQKRGSYYVYSCQYPHIVRWGVITSHAHYAHLVVNIKLILQGANGLFTRPYQLRLAASCQLD